MKKSRFSEQNIAFFLKRGDEGVAVAEIGRNSSISEV